MSSKLNNYSIVIPVYNNFDIAKKCIELIVKNTPSSIQIIVIDDASTQGPFVSYISEFECRIKFVRNQKNLGFVLSANIGVNLAGINDVILVNSDVFVVNNWSVRLQSDAYRSDLIATVTAMADRGSIATVQLGQRTLFGCSVSELEEISNHLDRLPELPPAVIPVGVGHCLYIKRIAIEQVGGFSEEFSPGYGEEVDFCLRAVRAGFIHTMSNSVIVQHLGGTSFGARADRLKNKHNSLIDGKFPNYVEYIRTSTLHNDVSETIFLRALTYKYGIRVLIDGRKINQATNGTGIVSLELAKYLSNATEFIGSIRVLVNSNHLSNVGKEIFTNRITEDELNIEIAKCGKYDVFFTPFQVENENFFTNCKMWAFRSVILQLDFIAFDNPFYHESIAKFRSYQKYAIAAGQIVDRVLFNSEFVASESVRALQSFKLDAPRLSVIGNGLNHLSENNILEKPISPIPQIGIIGSAFHHKNRIFGLEIVSKLQDKFPGAKLHLIGANPVWGSSVGLEDDLLESNHGMSEILINHGNLTENEKSIVIKSLDLLLVPSLSEGFGLAPFDGLPFGVPSLFPRLHSTFEILPDAPFYLSLIDVNQALRDVEILLIDKGSRARQIEYLSKVKENLNWQSVGLKVTTAIEEVVLALPKFPKSINSFDYSKKYASRDTFLRYLGNTWAAYKFLPPGSNRRSFVIQILKSRNLNRYFPLLLGKLQARLSFDKALYKKQLIDLNLPSNLGYQHFDAIGWRIRLNPNNSFNTHFYLERNPDVETFGKNPLEHYYLHGKREGRLPNYSRYSRAFIKSGSGTHLEISDVSEEFSSRIFITAGKNCRVIIKGIEVIETALSIHMADNCTLIIESGQRIRGPVAINLNEASMVTIGESCLFANNQIFTSDSHSVLNAFTGERTNSARDIHIGSNVWLGSGAMILKGADIGAGSIVGALAVVTGKTPANSMIAGNPGRVVKQDIAWTEEII